jgi:hypothetical protein
MLALNRSQGIVCNKCSESLGFDYFYMQSPYNPLIEDYTEIFYMINEGDVPSVQCDMSLRCSKAMKNIYGRSFILIYFKSKPKSRYDRRSVGQSIMVSSPIWGS